MKRIALLILGWFFIVFAIVCTLIPVMPQAIFYIIGITILSGVSPRARLWVRRLKEKYPKFRSFMDAAAARGRTIKGWFRKGD
ncbi:MAG: hypothetical protein EXS24_06260 [Pedosphaera sp.]|nr:hypothetical protein [Pedosphaera sp.]